MSGSSGNTVRNNPIGPDKYGQPLAASNAVLGGVVISSDTGNRIPSNSIFSNADLGKDLRGGTQSPEGITENDGDDPNTSRPDPDKDIGANRLQNHPVITSAQTFGSFTSVNGTLENTPSTRKKTRTFIIQLFSIPEIDPSDTNRRLRIAPEDASFPDPIHPTPWNRCPQKSTCTILHNHGPVGVNPPRSALRHRTGSVSLATYLE